MKCMRWSNRLAQNHFIEHRKIPSFKKFFVFFFVIIHSLYIIIYSIECFIEIVNLLLLLLFYLCYYIKKLSHKNIFVSLCATFLFCLFQQAHYQFKYSHIIQLLIIFIVKPSKNDKNQWLAKRMPNVQRFFRVKMYLLLLCFLCIFSALFSVVIISFCCCCCSFIYFVYCSRACIIFKH